MSKSLINLTSSTIDKKNTDKLEPITLPRFKNIEVSLHQDLATLEVSMLHPERPNYTIDSLQDFLSAFHWAKKTYLRHFAKTGKPLFKFLVSSCKLVGG